MNQAILSLHGFPGPARIKQKSDILFSDELEKLVNDNKHARNPVLLTPSYPGIIDENEFGFKRSLDFVKLLLPEILKQYESIDILARSFGGYALLYALHHLDNEIKEKINNIIFITPLVKLPPVSHVETVIRQTETEAPGVLDQSRIEDYINEIIFLNEHFMPFKLFSKQQLSISMYFIGAKEDQVTPASSILEFSNVVGAKYIEIGGDHEMGDKKEIIATLKKILF